MKLKLFLKLDFLLLNKILYKPILKFNKKNYVNFDNT